MFGEHEETVSTDNSGSLICDLSDLVAIQTEEEQLGAAAGELGLPFQRSTCGWFQWESTFRSAK